MSRLMSFSPLLFGFGPTLKSSEFISQNRLTTWTKRMNRKSTIYSNPHKKFDFTKRIFFRILYIFFTISIALDFPIQYRFYGQGNFNIYFQLKKKSCLIIKHTKFKICSQNYLYLIYRNVATIVLF